MISYCPSLRRVSVAALAAAAAQARGSRLSIEGELKRGG